MVEFGTCDRNEVWTRQVTWEQVIGRGGGVCVKYHTNELGSIVIIEKSDVVNADSFEITIRGVRWEGRAR